VQHRVGRELILNTGSEQHDVFGMVKRAFAGAS
jgi:hypothetical protein